MIPKTLRLSDLGSFRGATVKYREQGNGETLVFIHGVGMCADSWYPQEAYFSLNYRVVCLNMPGHGGSSSLPEKSELRDFVVWLTEVLDALSLNQINLAGHSMGALMVLGYALSNPGNVLRVAILNGVYRRSPESRESVEARAEQIKKSGIDVTAPLKRWFENGNNEPAYEKVKEWLEQVDTRGYSIAYHAFALGDDVYADDLHRLRCPALFLTADGDSNSTVEMTRKMANIATHGHARVIRGHRHMVHLTAPQSVNEALTDWLALPLGETKREHFIDGQKQTINGR